MNVENILKLADHLESVDDIKIGRVGSEERPLFSMTYLYDMTFDCGTAACIAGHAVLMFGDDDQISDMKCGEVIALDASEHLGIGNAVAIDLFVPVKHGVARCAEDDPSSPGYISHNRAAAQLRHLAEHGSVDWSATP